MNSNFYSILVGFNEYKDKENFANLRFAEKDAQDFHELLVDPKIGGYPPSNIELLVGKSTTTENLEQKLFQFVVKNRREEDTVVVYFSGHGFIAGDDEQAYLATPDVTILDILKNPRRGLKMDYLHNDIFLASKASCVIFFLDCCHSGAFVPRFNKEGKDRRSGTIPSSRKGLIDDMFFRAEGRVAFVSSPKGVSSRESRELKNGIFTHHLLDGLRGKAIETFTGVVTLNSLIPYVQALTPASQPPVRYGRDTGRIILTSPQDPGSIQIRQLSQRDLGHARSTAESKADEQALVNPIKNEIIYVDKFLKYLREFSETSNPVNTKLLSAVNSSLGGELAVVVRVDAKGDVFPKGFARSPEGAINSEDIESLLANANDIIHRDTRDLLAMRYGLFTRQRKTAGRSNKFMLVVPLRLHQPKEFVILSDVPHESLKYGEVIGHTLISAHNATNEFSDIDLLKTEATIFDDLRKSYGYLPYDIFERRLRTFREKLQSIIYYYEPIIELDKQIEIDSWEALARDPVTDRAPVDLFKAAELWGSEFIKALDLHTLRKAITSFSSTWRKENKGKKMDPLSINLYPETIFFDDYISEVKKIVKEEGIIKGTRIVFEISEKHPLPSLSDKDQADLDGTDEFSKRLKSISEELNVGFAIDDFGVGHSSVSRLTRLELAHVKIDREILHHEHPETTIRYVLKQVHQPHANQVKVIVEGFDGDSRIGLNTLYHSLNIQFIQGHLIRRASPSLRFLSNAKLNYLQKILLNEQK